MSIYEFAINNTKAFLRSEENINMVNNGAGLNAFVAAETLSIAFMKNYSDVVADLISKVKE